MLSRYLRTATIALGLAAGLLGRDARAIEVMRPFIEQKAKGIHDRLKVLKVHSDPELTIGYIIGSDPGRGSAQSPGFTEMLRRSLVDAGVRITDDAPYRIEGRYDPIVEKERPNVYLGVNLRFVVVDKANPGVELDKCDVVIDEQTANISKAELQDLMRELFQYSPDPARLTVVQVDAPKGDGQKAEVLFVRDAQDAIINGYTINGDVLTHTDPEGRPLYSLAIGTGRGEAFRPLPLDRDQAQFTADVRGANEIVVRLINHTKEEVAVELSLDGVSMFAFSEEVGRPNRYLLVAPKSEASPYTDVVGWYKNKDRSWTFRLVDLGSDESVQRLAKGRVGELGLVTARFSRCSSEKLKGLGDERRVMGRGCEVDAKYNLVKRYVEDAGQLLAIRYRPADAATIPSASQPSTAPAANPGR